MKVVIIYNPNSTGNGKENAKRLARQLRKEGLDVKTLETKFAKHGEEIAAKYAKEDEEIILISSSGDGGYHEVVNGVLKHPARRIVVGVLPSGNANDHYSATASGDLVAAIRDEKFRKIDTIKVIGSIDGEQWIRYAHSYVGIGVTARAARQLTVERPNVISEKWIVLRSLLSFRYSKVKEKKHTKRYSSLVFGNIDRMSKVVRLSENNSITDGKFEVAAIEFHSKLRLIGYLLTAATVGLKQSPSAKRYKCKTIGPLHIQLDGEVYTLDANSKLVIESAHQNLRCVL